MYITPAYGCMKTIQSKNGRNNKQRYFLLSFFVVLILIYLGNLEKQFKTAFNTKIKVLNALLKQCAYKTF
jgi:hypothetical protein